MDGSLRFEFCPFLVGKDLHGFLVPGMAQVVVFDGWVRDGSLVKPLEVVWTSEQVPVLLSKMTE